MCWSPLLMKPAPLLLCLMFLLSGCQKIMDYYERGQSEIKTSCRISHYSYSYYDNHVNTFFDYDVHGNPITITYNDEWLPEGQAKEFFIYDQFDRLVSHEPDAYMGNRRTYIYEGDSRNPLRDTVEDLYGNKYVESFAYDLAGRITREEIDWVIVAEGFESEFEVYKKEIKNYYYDVHGNRQVNPYDRPWHTTIKYSDKPSLYSLHPTWQLIYRDFSKNNASRIKSVNEKGLPLDFHVSDFDYWQPFFDLAQNAQITYMCN
jgi:hypothetical protein